MLLANGSPSSLRVFGMHMEVGTIVITGSDAGIECLLGCAQDVKDPAVDQSILDMKNHPTLKSSLWNAVTGL